MVDSSKEKPLLNGKTLRGIEEELGIESYQLGSFVSNINTAFEKHGGHVMRYQAIRDVFSKDIGTFFDAKRASTLSSDAREVIDRAEGKTRLYLAFFTLQLVFTHPYSPGNADQVKLFLDTIRHAPELPYATSEQLTEDPHRIFSENPGRAFLLSILIPPVSSSLLLDEQRSTVHTGIMSDDELLQEHIQYTHPNEKALCKELLREIESNAQYSLGEPTINKGEVYNFYFNRMVQGLMTMTTLGVRFARTLKKYENDRLIHTHLHTTLKRLPTTDEIQKAKTVIIERSLLAVHPIALGQFALSVHTFGENARLLVMLGKTRNGENLFVTSEETVRLSGGHIPHSDAEKLTQNDMFEPFLHGCPMAYSPLFRLTAKAIAEAALRTT